MNYLLNILVGLLFCSSVFAESNSIGIEMVSIKSGEFEMSTGGESRELRDLYFPLCNTNALINEENSSFKAVLTKGFFISQNEITVGQFKEFVKSTGYKTEAEKSGKGIVAFNPTKHDKSWAKGQWKHFFETDKTKNWKNPGFPQDDFHPVVGVSWNDAKAFCNWLSKKEGKKYRLPTEAEWEYTCRAGTKTFFSFGDKIRDVIHTKANIGNVELEKKYPDMIQRQWLLDIKKEKGDKFLFTAPVGSFPANQWGLNDMHGNVWEWCEDYYNQFTYKQFNKKTATDLLNTKKENEFAELRIVRGGSWYNGPMVVRSAARGFFDAPDAASYIGFRIVKEK